VIRPVRTTTRSGQILILLMASLLGGSAVIGAGMLATGSTIGEIQDRVDERVSDKARRKSCDQVLESWKKDSEKFLEANAERRDGLLVALERHATEVGELQGHFSRMQAANQKIQATVLDRRFALKQLLTREEWQKVFPPR
jgi:septal ring factor EnvC (AmiA/AmiB activator)